MTENTINALKPHISLKVSDLEASVTFYQKLFGIEPMKHYPTAESNGRPGYAKFDVASPPLNLALNEGVVSAGGVLSHLGIQVASTDDVAATQKRWADGGLTSVEEVGVDCCYAVQDKAWVSDPDGNEWEVFTVLSHTTPETADDSKGACCTPVGEPITIGSKTACC